jgi:hypothetical protein
LSGRETVCAAAMHRDSLGLAAYIMKMKMHRRSIDRRIEITILFS